MGRKFNYSKEEKLNVVQDYLNGKRSMNSIAHRLGTYQSTVKLWVNKFKAMDDDAFSSKHNKQYLKSKKEQAVVAYLAGTGSLMDICYKFKIPSTTQLRQWIKKYNSHEELKTSRTGGTVSITKGRNTTFEERVEIASSCISQDHNYAGTDEGFKISYQQARNYTVKYVKNGIDALQEKRGKRKPVTSGRIKIRKSQAGES